MKSKRQKPVLYKCGHAPTEENQWYNMGLSAKGYSLNALFRVDCPACFLERYKATHKPVNRS
jgi:hypothetical protein